MATLILEHRREGALAPATAIYLRDPTATYGVLNNATGLPAIVPQGPIAESAVTGVYEYNVDALVEGSYLAQFEIQNTGQATRWHEILFTIEDAAAVLAGVRLMDLEQRLARRVGPYRDMQVATGSLTAFTANKLKTAIPVGGYEDLYVLRRGLQVVGTTKQRITGFNEEDRVRQVFSYDNVSGEITVDANYAIAPVTGEWIELHYLHPEEELRYSLVEGLRRCFFVDAINLSFASGGVEQNLSALMPWLIKPEWIKDALWTYLGSLAGPSPLMWWKPHREGNDVILRFAASPYPNPTRLIVLRPHFSWVNGVTSLTGPNHDDDILNIDVNYGVASGHVEAWRNFPDKLMPAAQGGLHPSLAQVAQDFTNLGRTYGRYEGSGRVRFPYPFGGEDFPVVNR